MQGTAAGQHCSDLRHVRQLSVPRLICDCN